MGCDIHEYAEIFLNGKWVFVEPKQVDASYKAYSGKPIEYWRSELNIGRNYVLFGILAQGVRSVYFPTVIPNLRGTPRNASSKTKSGRRSMGVDGHSHSWLLLSELLAYPWKQKRKKQGYVSKINFTQFLKDGKPYNVDYETLVDVADTNTGRNRPIISNDEMRALGTNDTVRLASLTHIEFEECPYDYCKDFVDKILPLLESYGRCRKHDDCLANSEMAKACWSIPPEHVRLLYFFDN